MNVNDLASRLQEFARALRSDLVEKRLLPVVVLLVVAVVGIPVAYSVTNKSAPAVPPLAPSVPSGPGAALVAATPPKWPSGSLGHLHDPFATHVPATSTGTTGPSSPIAARPPSTGTTGPSGNTPTASTPSRGTTGPGGATGTSPGNTPKPPAVTVSKRELTVYHVDFRFGQGAALKSYKDAVRLGAVPSNTAPVAQLLGVSKDTRKGVFLIWGPATASGDGFCIDGQTPCQVVELKPGQTEFVDVQVPGAGIVQFELDMLAIHKRQAADRAEALKAHMLQSTDGVQVLSQSTATALSKFEYSTAYGTLLPRPPLSAGAPTGTTGPTGATGAQQASSASSQASSAGHPSASLGSHRPHHN